MSASYVDCISTRIRHGNSTEQEERAADASRDLLKTCLRMKKRITELQNELDMCWLDWPYAYVVDALIEKATGMD